LKDDLFVVSSYTQYFYDEKRCGRIQESQDHREAHRKVGAPQMLSFPTYTTRRTGLKLFGDSKKRLPAFISMRALF